MNWGVCFREILIATYWVSSLVCSLSVSLLQSVSKALSLNLFKKGNSCLCVLVELMNGRLLSAQSMTESGCQRDRAEVKGTLFQASLPPLG